MKEKLSLRYFAKENEEKFLPLTVHIWQRHAPGLKYLFIELGFDFIFFLFHLYDKGTSGLILLRT